MTEVLSQHEIDQLFKTMKSMDEDIPESTINPDQKRVKLYDFKRPDKFSKEQMRTLSFIHETFTQSWPRLSNIVTLSSGS